MESRGPADDTEGPSGKSGPVAGEPYPSPRTAHVIGAQDPDNDPYDEKACEAFFASEPEPHGMREFEEELRHFIRKHDDRPIVLVTSGGTTVPLEQNTVRFLDNFSAGTRGAASAERFLDAGYAVIFLHRRFSMSPYTRHFVPTINNFMEYLVHDEHTGVTRVEAGSRTDQLLAALRQYQSVRERGVLLPVAFTSLVEYLYRLRAAAVALRPHGARAALYLAAAVSDFYLPTAMMARHKIQSSEGPLTLCLENVPKMLKQLVSQWCPQAFVVSFKLETDPAILVSKARTALRKYGQHLVVANLLHDRKDTVLLVTAADIERVVRGEHAEIEDVLVQQVVRRHEAFQHCA